MYGIIIKDDMRYDFTQAFLESKGFEFKDSIDEHEQPTFIIFPFKQVLDEAIYNETLSRISPDVLVFSGIYNKYLATHINYFPIMDNEAVSIQNAIPTAEGIISYIIQSSKKTIADSSILVIGYGRCGSVIANKLSLLGANVYTKTLLEFDYAKAKTHNVLSDRLDVYDIIINTAPCNVMSDIQIRNIKDALLIDITNNGFNVELANNKKSTRLLAIPGRFAIQTAGEILGEYVYRRTIECLKGKKSDLV